MFCLVAVWTNLLSATHKRTKIIFDVNIAPRLPGFMKAISCLAATRQTLGDLSGDTELAFSARSVRQGG